MSEALDSNDLAVKYRSQRIKKPSNRQMIYETNFDEKIDSPKRKYRKRKKKLEKLRLKEKLKKKNSTNNVNNVIIKNSNVKIENNQNIFICLDESFKQHENIGLKKKLRFILFLFFKYFVIIIFFYMNFLVKKPRKNFSKPFQG